MRTMNKSHVNNFWMFQSAFELLHETASNEKNLFNRTFVGSNKFSAEIFSFDLK